MKIRLFAMALAFSLLLSGCVPMIFMKNSFKKNETTVIIDDSDRFTLEFDGSLEIETIDGAECYTNSLRNQLYRVSGVTSNFGKTTDECVEKLMSVKGEQSLRIVEPVSDSMTDLNGVKFKTACLSKESMYVYVVVSEEKNLMVTIAGQYGKDSLKDTVLEKTRKIAESIEFIETPEVITGNSYTVKDYGIIQFDKDGTCFIYQDEETKEESNVSGEYEVFRGSEAIEKVASMTEYGLTSEEQSRIIHSSNGFYDNYYAVIITINEITSDVESTLDKPSVSLYVGQYDEEVNSFMMTACNLFTVQNWQLLFN